MPPYVLEALAASGDPHLEAHASATLAVDRALRHGRRTGTLRPEGAGGRPRVARGGPDAPQRVVYDARGGTTLPGTRVRGEGDPLTDDTAVTEAYDGLGATWTLWSEAYERNSLDGKGLPLLASVHYGRLYDNAFWDGSQMVFGDGDGVVFLGFTRSLDVIGHELAHGVTQYTSGLNYQDQSGALNESVSDVFGVLVAQHLRGQTADEADWLVGAELLAPGVKGVALRSMAAPGTAYDDPRLGRDPQPAHMDGYVDTTDDNGGVHINSGIPNKAFHVVATTLGGKAWEAAGQVWYDTITGDIRADCDFATFAGLTVAAATRRFGEGSREVDAVRGGWDAVGVSTEGGSPRGRGRTGSAPADDATDAGTRVRVRRTGGVAGIVRERTVAIGALPDPDTRAWQRLLAGDHLPRLAAAAEEHRGRPDAFCYSVHCERPAVEVDLPEPVVPDEVRDLLERTLAAD
ncbi:MAG TPA: protealysin inhibitor emfourin [Phycicoccus sp.]|nr:protealysin inhibitor emfourin [Phycicoccus sp.]